MKAWLVIELPEHRDISWLREMLEAYGIILLEVNTVEQIHTKVQRLQEPTVPGEDVDPETILPKEY